MTATKKTDTPPPVTPKVATKKPLTRPMLTAFFLLIALIALGASGYCYFLITQQRQQLALSTKTQFADITQRVQHVTDTLNALNQSNNTLKKTLSTHQSNTAQSLETLQESQKSLQARFMAYQQSPRVNVGQDLLTLHFLNAMLSLQLAEQSIRLNRPAPQIQQSLALARRNILPLGDMARPFLNQLQDFSMGFSDLPSINTLSLIKAINTLDQQLETLAFRLPVDAQKADASKEKSLSWQATMQQSWQTLKQFLVINHDSNVDHRLITHANRLSALQSIRMDLALAKWGVIEGNAAAFQQGLAMAKAKTTDTFQGNDAREQWLTLSERIAVKPVGYPIDTLSLTLDKLYKMLATLQSQATKH